MITYRCDIFVNGDISLPRDRGRELAATFADSLERLPVGYAVRVGPSAPEYVPLISAAEAAGRAVLVGSGTADEPVAVELALGAEAPMPADPGPLLDPVFGIGAGFWTSGTTGNPRLVLHTYQALSYQAEATASLLRFSSVRWGVSLPLDHAYGYSVANLARTFGSELHWFSPTSTKKLARSLAAGELDTLDTIPRMWKFILDLARRDPAVMRGLRGLLLRGVGGQLLAPNLALAFEQADAPLNDGYGLTEAGPNVAINVSASYESGSVGRPLPGTELRVVEGELLSEKPVGLSVAMAKWACMQ
ncbi:AMP-binding protein [Plantibacter sp. RU18]|uniref:AMP-binding protein n=1 Tax=Plantibacter sp. RU18 TaxID=3158143 RepID=UPI003D35DA52